jgi:hypothetical protein
MCGYILGAYFGMRRERGLNKCRIIGSSLGSGHIKYMQDEVVCEMGILKTCSDYIHR